MPEYALVTGISILAVVLVELVWLRTGIFVTGQYWVTVLIVFAFQVPVDGWLTKLSNPIVIYAPEEMLGVRFPWDIPIEDFGFGWSMVTLALLLWTALPRRARPTNPVDQQETQDG
ncbi:MAG: lycopene cyclase domain-containing protein [Propionibacteriaceae bacterium]